MRAYVTKKEMRGELSLTQASCHSMLMEGSLPPKPVSAFQCASLNLVLPPFNRITASMDPAPANVSDTSMEDLMSALAQKQGDGMQSKIELLRKLQKEKMAEKQDLTRQLRNAQRKRTRLMTKAKLLSSTDLMEVMAMRATNVRKKNSAPSDADSSATPPENASSDPPSPEK